MTLLAQLSTAAGIRAPLAHVADELFVSLARELEAQGIGRKVAADMFGLALRTYQRKVQRLEEGVTQRGRTLWEAILDYVAEEVSATRRQVLARFTILRDDRGRKLLRNDRRILSAAPEPRCLPRRMPRSLWL